jgi:polar amino acid transport system substrate-binding protein
MRRLATLLPALALAFAALGARADLLADIRSRGEIVVGVKDSVPPFGFIEEGSRRVVGYDIDFAAAIARGLGVRLRAVPVTTATRIPELQQGKIDLIVATMTRTAQREEQIDFSFRYFVTGQKVLVKKSARIAKVEQLSGRKVSSVRGSTSEQNIRAAVPAVQVVAFSDYPAAFLALSQGKVQAMTTDETILLALQLKASAPSDYILLEGYISEEPYGIGIRKGEAGLRDAVNRILLDLEESGEAKKIYETWFGPKSQLPLKRSFRIESGK